MTSGARTPKIHVGPQQLPELLEAVKTAGGEVVDDPAQAEALVWWGGSPDQFKDVDHDGIKWVQLPSAGIESWFRAGIFTSGKVYTCAVGSYADGVAEHTLALMLGGLRQLHTLAGERTWTGVRSGTLLDSTVGIVGCGGIGRALIRMLEPLRVRVLAITRSGTPVPGAAHTYTPDRLDDVLSASDVVVIGAPSTAETKHLIGARELELMQPHAWLVNIARGSLIDTDALVEALRAGSIAGAGLDVTDPEPLPDGHPLWDEPRALITPHSANPPSLLIPGLTKRVNENVRRYVAGEKLVGLVEVERGY
ncbi:Phosphoglycerate dehydrogenase [Actinopolymorpha cephalotaxi]|uniref:Phosphoglycerate dehydrogenase n=1 Tax=Actinopolymorpha cephalotaxi TaxID=504797 RepID=A0A1I2LTR6_9ACTN|nr:D-isomer specific 2-hydroxyacid dehydrogenase family protein [Actinopolymorpha cephalotaxi]NYH81450.1 phosphoglycerate dehydrogenase-like enzyme [Actinopolymorpha cephalotaxi]SFF82752.1 Phosphoglycerate dehydrogenase [Actinopolymorpha cephalotaxi]